jgi:hypothetical protein
MSFLQRLKQAITRSGSTTGPAISGGPGGAGLGVGPIEAIEREEFPPEEFASDENEESES